MTTTTIELPRELFPPYSRIVERDASAPVHDLLFALAVLAIAALIAAALLA
jgi:hypothetical protein